MIAKNNIFNIRKGLGAKWQGETGARKGFVEFETREYGIRAWIVWSLRHASTAYGRG